jgi:hypothetical protein
MDKVRQYTKSDAGNKRMTGYIKHCRENGKSATEAGAVVVTEQDMIRAAEALIKILQEPASQKGLPESVMEHFYSLYYNEPIPYGKEGGQYKVDVQFGDDLSRMSLRITSGKRKGERTGEPIENIVSLFDTGYDTSKRVYGAWDGHGDETIASLTHRDPLNFMEEALTSFNRQYGAIYNVVAYISAEDPRFYASSRDLGDGMFL